MKRFYTPDIETDPILPEEESGHCCRVLRMQAGDTIHLVDGKGYAYECRIVQAHPKHTEVEVLSKEAEPPYWKGRITLAVAPTKNIDRIEWLMEKAVEIGVDELVLVECTRNERHKVNKERLEKLLVSAMKQSLKSTLPVFPGLVKLSDFVANCNAAYKAVGYCDADTPRLPFCAYYPGNADVAILIGPEGDFTPEEIKMVRDNGFSAVTFGDTRLRTETAALYGLTAVHVMNSIFPV